mgnify:CR=1 FL=1
MGLSDSALWNIERSTISRENKSGPSLVLDIADGSSNTSYRLTSSSLVPRSTISKLFSFSSESCNLRIDFLDV